MTFKHLAEYLSELEKTSLRLEITEILSRLYREADLEEIGKISYLLQGRVAPLFEAVEFGMADKMIIRSVSLALNISVHEVTRIFKEEGDLGKAAEKIKNSTFAKASADKQNSKLKNNNRNLHLVDVYNALYKIAVSGGEGSQEEKIRLLANLISDLDPLSVRFVVRIPVNKLRLGFSDMTVLDALSWMIGGNKELRKEIETAYNVRPDLGFISSTLKSHGIEGLMHVKPEVGTPILMMRAERMTSGKDIIEKLGKCAVEPKYDGFRLQIHYSRNKEQRTKNKTKHENLSFFSRKEQKRDFVRLFSRNLEDVTHMYPDVVEGVCRQIQVKEAIFEGEAIGINIKTGQYLPFQETVQRKRKYDIEVKAKEIPLKLFTFDVLYTDGRSILNEKFTDRRKMLTHILSKGKDVYIADQYILDDPHKLETIFEDATRKGLEGVMAKKLDGVYQAGARGFNWIKYKKSYAGKLTDTIDCLVMGYDFGQGKRSGFGIGDFLIGVYDPKSEKFLTVAKIGTGLTDDEWRELKLKSQKLKIQNKPSNYEVDKAMSCDVWVQPKIMVEIRADEITRSPVHTAGRVMGPSKSGSAVEVKTAGFALRFPRLERFREDRSPRDATTVAEVSRIFSLQGK